MRELKFRAWNKRDHKMIYAPYHLLHDGYFDYNFKNNVSQNYIEPEYVMQYTGLKDKTGKEIYEGDIVLFKYFDESVLDLTSIGEVIITEPLGLILSFPKKIHIPMLGGYRDFEIIGNLYETPELLKKD